MKTKYKIVNKRRFILCISTALLVVYILGGLILRKGNKVYSLQHEESYIDVFITEGDTLWNIAIDHMPGGYDVRKMLYDIIEYNDIEDVNIYPGDLIKVPIR